MRLDRIQQRFVGQPRVIQPQLAVRRAFLAQHCAEGMPMRRTRSSSPARLGGVFGYSMMTGSTPVARITANVLRDVPQAGLW